MLGCGPDVSPYTPRPSPERSDSLLQIEVCLATSGLFPATQLAKWASSESHTMDTRTSGPGLGKFLYNGIYGCVFNRNPARAKVLWINILCRSLLMFGVLRHTRIRSEMNLLFILLVRGFVPSGRLNCIIVSVIFTEHYLPFGDVKEYCTQGLLVILILLLLCILFCTSSVGSNRVTERQDLEHLQINGEVHFERYDNKGKPVWP